MDDLDIDDYSRDRSRSPVRDRSRSPSSAKDTNSAYSRRDYSFSSRGRYGSGSAGRDSSNGDSERRSERGQGSRRGRGGDGSSRGGRNDFGSRRSHGNGGGGGRHQHGAANSNNVNADEYRSKTERNYDNSIFIGNIPFNCTSRDVEQIFKNQYHIVRADIVTNRGQSRGMATVEFSNKDDVRTAIQNFDHHEYRGREIFVRQDYPPPSDKKKDFHAGPPPARGTARDRKSTYESKRPATAPPASRERFSQLQAKAGTEIFVGNLPFSINWQALKDLMRGAGDVVRADVRTDNWGKSRGFGTVVFATPEAAARAVEDFQGYEIEGRKLDTRPGRAQNLSGGSSGGKERDHYSSGGASGNGSDSYGGSGSYQGSGFGSGPSNKNTQFTQGVTGDGDVSATIYAANLPYVTNVDDLYELFETIGRVTNAEIQYTEQGKPSGNAVIEFELEELADLAIKNLHNYNYGGRDLKITYAKRSNASHQREQEEIAQDDEMEVAGPADDVNEPEAEVEIQPEAEIEAPPPAVDDQPQSEAQPEVEAEAATNQEPAAESEAVEIASD